LCSLVFLKGKLPDVSNDAVWHVTLHDCGTRLCPLRFVMHFS